MHDFRFIWILFENPILLSIHHSGKNIRLYGEKSRKHINGCGFPYNQKRLLPFSAFSVWTHTFIPFIQCLQKFCVINAISSLFKKNETVPFTGAVSFGCILFSKSSYRAHRQELWLAVCFHWLLPNISQLALASCIIIHPHNIDALQTDFIQKLLDAVCLGSRQFLNA